ncbi:MAG: apolipoprotein N-acyltransferase [Prolixibacteraceae bacterium]|nr:apolipoprotein N-acyltransferase [Prolixibacteraceae bacterium]
MKRIHRILLSVLSGILLCPAWLGFPGWTLFVAFIPLLILDRFFVEQKERFRGVLFWGHTLLSFLIWNVLTTWWLANATLLGALMAIMINSFLMSLVWWLAHTARRNFKSPLGYVALIVFWISFEYFHYHWDIEWPWLNLGNGFANNVKIVQWYEFTGTPGGTLWVLLMNILIFKIVSGFYEKKPVRQSIYPISAFVIFLLVPIFYSLTTYSLYSEKGNLKNIVIVQPNVDPYSESYDLNAENEKLNNFIGLADAKADEKTDYIVGPETVFERYPDWMEGRFQYNTQYLRLTKWVKQYHRANLVLGVSTGKIYRDKNHATPTARTRNGVTYDVFNSALFIGNDGNLQIYHKSILVSGVEKVPFMKYFGFLKNLIFDLGGSSGSLGRQNEASVFTSTDSTTVAPVICYESVFGEYVTSYVNKGAELIFIITNDGWWRNTPGYKQHMSFARLRAIETRRSIARSANTGISCFINQKGEIVQQSDWWKAEVLKGQLITNNKQTFYVKHGDYIARISLFVGILLLLYLIANRLGKDKKNPH